MNNTIFLKDIEDICKREFNENYLNPYLDKIVDKYFSSINEEEFEKLIKNLLYGY